MAVGHGVFLGSSHGSSSTFRNGRMARGQIEVIASGTDGTVLIYKPTSNLGAHPCGCLLRLIFLGHRIVVSFVSFYVMATLLSPRRAARVSPPPPGCVFYWPTTSSPVTFTNWPSGSTYLLKLCLDEHYSNKLF